MKKLVFTLIMVFLLSGCINEGKKTTDSIEDDSVRDVNLENIISKHHYKKYDFICEISTEDIKDYSGFDNMFLTKDGELYEWSLQTFTNETNCKKVDTKIKFSRFINGTLVGYDEKLYDYQDKIIKKGAPEGTGSLNTNIYDKYSDMFLFSRNYSVSDNSFDANHRYAIVKDNIVYETIFTSDNDISLFQIGEIPKDEITIGMYYNILKTNKNYYYYSVINREQCNKYADIECEFGLMRFNEISDIYEELQFYSPSGFIILKSEPNVIYSNQMGG